MKFLAVLTKKEFTNEAGEPEVRWRRCGTVKVTPNGGQYLSFDHLPELTYYLVPEESRKEAIIQLDE